MPPGNSRKPEENHLAWDRGGNAFSRDDESLLAGVCASSTGEGAKTVSHALAFLAPRGPGRATP